MRICFILPKILPASNGAIVGGVTNCTIGLALALSRKGVSVDVVAPINDGAVDALATHPVFPLLKGIKSADRSLLVRGGVALFDLRTEIKRRHSEHPYDIIHIHSGSYLYGFTLASRAFRGVAKIQSIYCPIFKKERSFIVPIGRIALARWATNNIDCLIGVTRNVYRSIHETKIYEKKILFIPMAVDTDEFDDLQKAEQTTLFYERKDSTRILFVGNASCEKGLEVLINALGILKKKGIDFQFIAAIENQSKLSDFVSRREIIENRVKELGLEMHVSLTGVVKRIRAYLEEAEILVIPFLSLPGLNRVSDYPMILLEGMACGKCVVATPLKGVLEVLKNGVNGILSESFSAESLSEAILQGILNNDLKRLSGIKGRNTIKKNYSTKIVASQLFDLYRKLLSVQNR